MNGVYDPALVVTSVLVAIIASYTALDLASSVARTQGRSQRVWLAAGSLAMGVGIWSMHFVGMLAFTLPGTTIAYDVPRLVLSILVAVVASAIALHVVSLDRPRPIRFVLAGLAMGAAIGGMHYIGMWSLHMAAVIEWRWSLVIASLVIAVGASFAALWLAFRLRGERAARGIVRRLAAGTVMGFAIAGMHYTAMFAAVFVPGGGIAVQQRDVLATEGLAAVVAGATFVILAIALAGSVVERELARRAAVAAERLQLLQAAEHELAQRREAERALRASEEQLRLALDAGGMGIWEWDRSTRAIVMSSACAEMHGLDAPFRGGWDQLEAAVHEDDRDAIVEASRAAVQGGRDYEAEYRVRRAGGAIGWVHARGRYSHEDGGRLIGVCVDVTRSRSMEEQLRQTEKMEAIGQLAGGVAHDFNNLLTTIQGNTALLLDSLHENDPRREGALEVKRAALVAGELTRQLLAFGRREMVRPRRVDLAALVRENEAMLRRVLAGEFRLNVGADEPAWIHADPVQIQQILLNLATNARDAMAPGGRLDIEAGPLVLEQPLVAHDSVLEPGRWSVLRVADEGSGIEPRALEHVFEPFYTTKAKGKGTGLGLATVYGIVKQLDGHLRVDTALGRGTAFVFYFPCAQTDAESVEPDAHASPPALATRDGQAAKRGTVLLVEDDASVRSLTRRMLVRCGYDVMEATTAEEALDLLDRHGRHPDLVVTDAVMPGMTGPALVREVRRRSAGVPALVMSGYAPESVLGERDTADFEFLQKPFTFDGLASKLERLARS